MAETHSGFSQNVLGSPQTMYSTLDNGETETCSLVESEPDEHDDEIPPFALPDDDEGGDSDAALRQHVQPRSSQQSIICQSQHVQYYYTTDSTLKGAQSSQSACSSQLPPALASSMMSCQTDDDESTQAPSSVIRKSCDGSIWGGGGGRGNSSLLFGGGDNNTLSSRHLEAAASLIANMAVTNDESQASFQVSPSSPKMHDSSLVSLRKNPAQQQQQTAEPFSSMEFSRLMFNADDRQVQGPVLPVLKEETTEDCTMRQSDSFHSARAGGGGGSSSFSFLSNIPSTKSQLYTSEWVQVEHGEDGYQPPVLASQNQQRTITTSLTAPLSQSVLRRSGVSVRQLDPVSFEASIEISSRCNVNDVMEVIGNSDYLILWCDSIRSLVITNSSEGARNAANRRGGGASSSSANRSSRAEYEGEWIEATTTHLISPPSTSSCFYNTSKAMWNYVGFPSNYGTVSMFVERQKGRVGLSMGPFAGDITVSHTLAVLDTGRTGMKIVDRVALSRGVTYTDLTCGVFDCLESCFLPTLKQYMDQVMSSLLRLRVLVETSERGHFNHSQSNNLQASDSGGDSAFYDVIVPPGHGDD